MGLAALDPSYVPASSFLVLSNKRLFDQPAEGFRSADVAIGPGVDRVQDLRRQANRNGSGEPRSLRAAP